jgi:hypothetical protein
MSASSHRTVRVTYKSKEYAALETEARRQDRSVAWLVRRSSIVAKPTSCQVCDDRSRLVRVSEEMWGDLVGLVASGKYPTMAAALDGAVEELARSAAGYSEEDTVRLLTAAFGYPTDRSVGE